MAPLPLPLNTPMAGGAVCRQSVPSEGGERTARTRGRRLGVDTGRQQPDEAATERDEDGRVRHAIGRTRSVPPCLPPVSLLGEQRHDGCEQFA